MDAGRDLIYGESPETMTSPATAPTSASQPLQYYLGEELRTVLTSSALAGLQVLFDDVIFGDHGIVVQQTADPNEPDSASRRSRPRPSRRSG